MTDTQATEDGNAVSRRVQYYAYSSDTENAPERFQKKFGYKPLSIHKIGTVILCELREVQNEYHEA